MSQETNASNQNQPIDYAPPQKPKKDNKWVYIAIIGVLVVTNIITLVSRNKVKEQRDEVQTAFNISDSSRAAVEADYSAALVRLDELVSQNTDMKDELSHRDSEIAILRQQIDAIVKNKNATAAELGKAKRLIDRLNGKVQTYEQRIASLESDNMRLSKERDILEKERSELDSEREQLIKLGSVLHASNIRMMPIDIKRGGKKVRETEKARRVDLMRIMFDIDENRIAEQSVNEIYLRITDPNGHVLSNAAYGSGMTTLDDGTPLNYTISKLISLDMNTPANDVTVDWQQDNEYMEGSYHIQIFQGGFMIGSGDVELK